MLAIISSCIRSYTYMQILSDLILYEHGISLPHRGFLCRAVVVVQKGYQILLTGGSSDPQSVPCRIESDPNRSRIQCKSTLFEVLGPVSC